MIKKLLKIKLLLLLAGFWCFLCFVYVFKNGANDDTKVIYFFKKENVIYWNSKLSYKGLRKVLKRKGNKLFGMCLIAIFDSHQNESIRKDYFQNNQVTK